MKSLRRRAFLVLVPWLALALACGGGGGGGSPTDPGPTPTPAPQASIVFTPQAGGAPGISLAAGAASTATTLVLEIRAASLTDLYGVAFDLTYPNQLLQFVSLQQGPFLQGATAQNAVLPDRLVVGLSRLGALPGENGSGVLMTITFRAIGAGQGSFTFSKNLAANSQGQAIPGLTWSAGTVQVTL